MGESFKAVCCLILIVAVITAAVVWCDDKPTDVVWKIRIGSALVSVLALVTLLAVHFRKDHAPDFLRAIAGNYFNRNGLCFSLSADDVDGVCQFRVYFQNQYERPCVGQVAVRPGRDFLMTRAKIEMIIFHIACDAAAFGVATIPIPVPLNRQGKKQRFEVGASVKYPDGKGRRLRFRDGIFLRADTQFDNASKNALLVAGVLTGSVAMVALSNPVTGTVLFPQDVATEINGDSAQTVRTLWKLGDPIPDSLTTLA